MENFVKTIMVPPSVDVVADVVGNQCSEVRDEVINTDPKEFTVERYLTVNAAKILVSILYTAVFFCVGLGIAMLGPALKTLQRQTFSTESEMGWLFISRGFGYMSGGLLSGRVYDNIEHINCLKAHSLLAIGTSCLSLTILLIPLISSLPVLCVRIFS